MSGYIKMSMLSGRLILSSISGIVRSITRPQLEISRLTTLSALQNKTVASFDEVKSVQTQKKTLLIDVREPSELQETGVIPGSINIPLDQVESALRDLPPQQFQKQYGVAKPEVTTPMIFSCRSGKRSANAQEVASKLGFKNIKNYEGGWLDWEEKNK